MAMLAEPRQRKRYNLVPRGKALYEDDSRFGTKMLEKMGWSKGKGLGASENGSKDFVRVRYKNDANGFGYEERDDQWTQHDESFDSLLQSLNGSEESGDDKSKVADECDASNSTVGFGFQQSEPKKSKHKLREKISGESLEEMSKKSKARVHYKKFTKGKDLAQYSEKDLANIFGKKVVEENVNDIYEQFTAITTPQNYESDKKKEERPVEELNFGVQMINTGLSVNDYFKQKMEAMKQKKLKQTVTETNQESNILDEIENTTVEDEPEKKKKKKQKRALAEEETIEEAETLEDAPSKKKKKIRVEQPSVEETSPEKLEESFFEEEPTKQAEALEDASKKKKKKIRAEQPLIKEMSPEKVGESLSKIPKKSKKSKDLDRASDGITGEDTISAEIKKTKKSKRNNTLTEAIVDQTVEADEVSDTAFTKKKKKKDNASQIAEEILPIIIAEEESLKEPFKDANSIELNVKCKKKKSKETVFDDGPNITNSSADHQNIYNTASKKKLNKKIKDVSENTDTSHKDYLEDLISKRNSYNLYIISSFCAEKFRNADLERFTDANLTQIVGYGLSDELKLDIRTIKSDEQRINQLWNCVLNKYDNAEPKNPYFKYKNKLHAARRTKQKMPRLCVKSLKRKHAFSGI